MVLVASIDLYCCRTFYIRNVKNIYHLYPKWLCQLESLHMSNGATHGGCLTASAANSFPEWMAGPPHQFAPKIPPRQKYFPHHKNTSPRPPRSHSPVGTRPLHFRLECSACFEAVSFQKVSSTHIINLDFICLSYQNFSVQPPRQPRQGISTSDAFQFGWSPYWNSLVRAYVDEIWAPLRRRLLLSFQS